jgi:hypothetical protein
MPGKIQDRKCKLCQEEIPLSGTRAHVARCLKDIIGDQELDDKFITLKINELVEKAEAEESLADLTEIHYWLRLIITRIINWEDSE